jgi:hypothetical protein
VVNYAAKAQHALGGPRSRGRRALVNVSGEAIRPAAARTGFERDEVSQQFTGVA